MRHLIIGTAGHIDHGKTALVKALTGIDTDRLKRRRSGASPSSSASPPSGCPTASTPGSWTCRDTNGS
jgi:hypothetical protein